MTKILHLEHPEDTILTGDDSFLQSLRLKGDLSVKVDGAPAIVWGTNPATGKFFVGTKSVFNKVKIKINESHQDIDANHTGEVATILHKCFDYLPRNGGIFQGDFIGFGGSDEYTPNTITYQFDGIVDAEIIVAPHTLYTAESDLRDAVAEPMRFIITDTIYCKFVFPKAYTWSGEYNYDHTAFEMPPILDLIRQVYAKTTFVTNKEAEQIKRNVNKSIREGYPMTNEDFLGNESLMHLYGLMIILKEELMYQCRNVGPRAFIGQDEVSGEGYVYSTELGTYKLVDRRRFSVANFNNTKFTTV
jgi:hypothetical protein|tara:strand:+ start:262 stop:1170 length:909 start_codon:yes stop_codon:yes gene_type:complete